MERRKLTKADIDKVRNIEGFPIGSDEDIIALSDAPFYTACPNPLIEEFIRKKSLPYEETSDDYHREPFAADVSEGKNDPIYNAYSYHTKVPHKAIMRYLLHYTKPGDVVYDGFCGSGMTGIAAQLCGSPSEEFRIDIEKSMPGAQWGCRNAVLSDLSPAATFISYNYNAEYSNALLSEKVEKILRVVNKECAWMYQTNHVVDGRVQTGIDGMPITGTIDFTLWSDIFICPTCSTEFTFWKVAANKEDGTVADSFCCPHCGSSLSKHNCQRAQESHFDSRLNRVVSMAKQVPVLIVYSVSKKRYEKEPDENDLSIIDKINASDIPYWYPVDELPDGFNTEQPKRSHGIEHVHQFFTKRNLWVLSCFWNQIDEGPYKPFLMQFILSSLRILSKQAKHNKERRTKNAGLGWVNAGVMGTLYVSSCPAEQSVLFFFSKKLKKLITFKKKDASVCISTNSCTSTTIPNSSIDYIFTDPPFGANLNYSELSFLSEAWLKCKTNTASEAIINAVQGKGLVEYQQIMTQCFHEYYRVLKPNRWMTVEFHNSQNSVWNAIQESLLRAGFIIADVRTLDKKQGSFKQVTTTSAVKQDLVISAYKPKESFTRMLLKEAGSEDTAWAFVRQHLANIPVVVVKNEEIEMITERQAFLLFDRMVAYHIMQGIPVPLDATDFYCGLDNRFLKRDNMYFLPDQVNEYDMARSTSEVEDIQFSLFVSDEKSAISWLYQQLDERSGDGPQTYAEFMPKFMQECQALDKREKMPELSVILEENFLKNDDGRWYIPDLTKSGDIAKLREKNLLKEFQEYLSTKGKLKVFRSEAIRTGFAKLWKDKDYATIVAVAERLPEETIQEDQNLLMYYDISLGRV